MSAPLDAEQTKEVEGTALPEPTDLSESHLMPVDGALNDLCKIFGMTDKDVIAELTGDWI